MTEDEFKQAEEGSFYDTDIQTDSLPECQSVKVQNTLLFQNFNPALYSYSKFV